MNDHLFMSIILGLNVFVAWNCFVDNIFKKHERKRKEKEISIKFIEWAIKGVWRMDTNESLNKWYNDSSEGKGITTKELYELFLKDI